MIPGPHARSEHARQGWLSALYGHQADELAKAQEEARQFLTAILPQIQSGALLFTPEGEIISRSTYEADKAKLAEQNAEYERTRR